MRVVALEEHFTVPALAQKHVKPEAIANRVYGGRLGNGSEASGDGWRYRGRGLLLLEDFGDDRVGPLLEREPNRERGIYQTAVDILARIMAGESWRDPVHAVRGKVT